MSTAFSMGGPTLGLGPFAHLRRSDVRAGRPPLVVHRDKVVDWGREVTLAPHGSGLITSAAYGPDEYDREADIVVFKALLGSFEEALAALCQLPAPKVIRDTTAQSFLSALARGQVALPDPSTFCLASGWHVDLRGQTGHWLHAHLPVASRYDQNAYARFLAATQAAART